MRKAKFMSTGKSKYLSDCREGVQFLARSIFVRLATALQGLFGSFEKRLNHDVHFNSVAVAILLCFCLAGESKANPTYTTPTLALDAAFDDTFTFDGNACTICHGSTGSSNAISTTKTNAQFLYIRYKRQSQSAFRDASITSIDDLIDEENLSAGGTYDACTILGTKNTNSTGPTDGGPRTVGCSTFTVTAPNQNPSVTTNPQSLMLETGQTGQVTVSATDPDGDQVSIGTPQSSDPSVATVSGSSPNYTVTANGAGSATITFTGNDGNSGSNTASIPVTVTNAPSPNQNPSVTTNPQSLTLETGQTGQVTVSATDPDGDQVSIGTPQSSDPSVATVSGSSPNYTVTANGAGSATITFTGNDGNGGTNTASVSVTVTNAPSPNQNPRVTTNPQSLTLETGQTGQVTVSATDPDGDQVSIGTPQSSDPSVATVSGSSPNYTVTANGAGSATITFTGNDGNGGSNTTSVPVTVTNTPSPNQNPSVTTNFPSLALETGQPGQVTVTATDPDGDQVSIETPQSSAPSVATVSGSFPNYTIVANSVGSAIISFTGNDGNGGTDTASVSVTVSDTPPPNQNPSVTTNLQSLALETGQSGQVSVTVTDLDGDQVSIGTPQSSDPSVATVSGSSPNYTITANSVGTATITFTGDDGNGGTNTASVPVTVTDTPPGNQNPSVTTNFPSLALETGQTGQVTVSAADPDGDQVSIGTPQSSDPSVATVSGSSPNYTVTANGVGTATITFTGNDGNDGTDTASVSVTVTDTPIVELPELIVAYLVDGTESNVNGSRLSLADGRTTTISVVVESGGAIQQIELQNIEGSRFVTLAGENRVQAVAPYNFPISVEELTSASDSNESALLTFSITRENGIEVREASVQILFNNPPQITATSISAPSSFDSDFSQDLVLPIEFSDIEDQDALQLELLSNLSNNGQSVAAENGIVTYQLPNRGAFTTADSIDIRVIDTGGKMAEATIDILPPDFDGDQLVDALDNCPTLVNPVQDNIDNDLFGDVCDPDVNGDNLLDRAVIIGVSDVEGEVVADVSDHNSIGQLPLTLQEPRLTLALESLAPPELEPFVAEFLTLGPVEWVSLNDNFALLNDGSYTVDEPGVYRVSANYSVGGATGVALVDIPITPEEATEAPDATALEGVSVSDGAQVVGGRFLLADAVSGEASGVVPASIFLAFDDFRSAAESLGLTAPPNGVESEIVADFGVRTMPGETVSVRIRLPQRVAQTGSVSLYLPNLSDRVSSQDILYASAAGAGCPPLHLPDGNVDQAVYNSEANGKSCIGIIASDGDSLLDADGEANGVVRITLIAPVNPINCDSDPACQLDFVLSTVGDDHAPLDLDRESGGGSFGVGFLSLLLAWVYTLFRHGVVTVNRLLIPALVVMSLVACRGEDDQASIDPEILDFIEAPDPDRFNLFLNTGLGTTNANADETDCIGEGCGYYKSIDPDNSRDTLNKWLEQNQFKADVSDPFGNCSVDQGCCVVSDNTDVDAQCSVVMAQASFRDTRDLGYGRDMYMRHDRVGGEIAVFVRNFRFNQELGLPEGLPYGPQNLEALVQNFHPAQFSISAIEYSAFPGNEQDLKFTKFYSFGGADIHPDGDGPRWLRTDIPERGVQVEMPNACSTCHGGRGRSVLDADGNLAPVLNGGIDGDVQAQLQLVDVTTLQFANASPFTKSDQQPFIRAINNAVLHSYTQYRDSPRPNGNLSSYWNPDHAIEYLKSRYDIAGQDCESLTPFDCLRGDYKETFTEDTTLVGWKDADPVAFRNLIAPNCLSCHLLRGSYASEGVSFNRLELFDRFADRTDDLVFARGLMPSGLWNYREFWDLKNPLPLAEELGFPASAMAILNENNIVGVQPPGRPVAKISAPPVAQSGSTIVVSATGSAFADQFEWTVTPESAAIIAEPNSAATEMVISDAADAEVFTIQLNARKTQHECSGPVANSDCSDVTSFNVALTSDSVSTPTDFFDEGGVGSILKGTCVTCHSDSGATTFPGIPVSFCSDEMDAISMYQSIRNRVNLENPTDSLLLRKPTNGAESLESNRESTAIQGYHAGGAVLMPTEISTILNWINTGALPDLSAAAVPVDFFNCN